MSVSGNQAERCRARRKDVTSDRRREARQNGTLVPCRLAVGIPAVRQTSALVRSRFCRKPQTERRQSAARSCRGPRPGPLDAGQCRHDHMPIFVNRKLNPESIPRPMKEQIAKLIERFPDRKAIIESLAGSDARFRSVLHDHHEVHRSLSRDEVSGDPATRADLERRFRNLEEELIRLVQGYPIA